MDRGAYVFGGYVVTQRIARPAYMSAELLPDTLITASPCLATFVPDTWSLGWTSDTDDQRAHKAAALGLSDDAARALRDHVTSGFENGAFGWPNIVRTADALAALRALLPRSPAWVALGLALHRDRVATFLDSQGPREGVAAGAVHEMLAQRHALPEGGSVLGFEPLGFEWASPHSWLCNQLETECFHALGVRPAANGLIATELDANRAAAHVARDDVGAEPALWQPWLLVDYTG